MVNLITDIISFIKQHNISDISDHSDQVNKDVLFFVMEQDVKKSSLYIQKAYEKGIKFIVLQKNNVINIKNTKIIEKIIYVEDIKLSISKAMDFLYPSEPKNIICVTGTNGKTSVVHYTRQILKKLGYACASIGTLGVITSNQIIIPKIYKCALTTPGKLSLKQILHCLSQQGVTHVVIEASSHGIKQNRLDKIAAKALGFSSFSGDHLDYHLTSEDYFKAKLLLFEQHATFDTQCVLSYDVAELFPQKLKNKLNILTISSKFNSANADVIFTSKIMQNNIKHISFSFLNKIFNFHTRIVGHHQILNLIISIFLVCGVEKKIKITEILELVIYLNAPSGRLERAIDAENIFIDYAHNADSLQKVLLDLQEIKNVLNSKSRIILVFGCGGDRDSIKRNEMGRVANLYADVIIVTDDNPRNEDPSNIRNQILSQCSKGISIANRVKAITYAINIKKKNDIILIAGKGHENYTIINDKKIFSKTDKEICVQEFLNT